MLDPEITNIIEGCRDIEEILEYSYIIRNRIITGEEFLDILEKYTGSNKQNINQLEKEKEEIEEELDILKNKYEKSRDYARELAIRYGELIKKNYTTDGKKLKVIKSEPVIYDKKIETIRKELKKYKGDFVDNLQRILEK